MDRNKSSNTLQRNIDLINSRGVAAADMSFTGRTEGIAGNRGDVFLLQERRAELFTAHPGTGDGRENIESTIGNKTFQAHIMECRYHKPAATVITFPHNCNGFIIVFSAYA